MLQFTILLMQLEKPSSLECPYFTKMGILRWSRALLALNSLYEIGVLSNNNACKGSSHVKSGNSALITYYILHIQWMAVLALVNIILIYCKPWNAEEETDPYKIPNKHNIRLALFWLVNGCQPGDSLVFHYSGHGSRQRNYNGDEVDGYDETLCPLDFETQGMIVDDEINATIVRPLPRGVKLHAIIDSCHSGTVLDLPFLCRMHRLGIPRNCLFFFFLNSRVRRIPYRQMG